MTSVLVALSSPLGPLRENSAKVDSSNIGGGIEQQSVACSDSFNGARRARTQLTKTWHEPTGFRRNVQVHRISTGTLDS